MEVLSGPCVGDVQDRPLQGQKRHTDLRSHKNPSRSPFLPAFPCHQRSQLQFEQSTARGTCTALKALVCPRLAYCRTLCPGIMLQDLHRRSGSAVWTVRAGNDSSQWKPNRRQYFFQLFLLQSSPEIQETGFFPFCLFLPSSPQLLLYSCPLFFLSFKKSSTV